MPENSSLLSCCADEFEPKDRGPDAQEQQGEPRDCHLSFLVEAKLHRASLSQREEKLMP